MISYRFKRRTFLTAMGGGLGLKVMLRNMEASAQTAQSPPRLLVTHWPVGIIPGAGDALWKPTSGAAGGYALQTFADNGLANDMISLRGISTSSLQLNGGGSHEGGTVVLVTGVNAGGTRTNRGEPDDAFAGGPSFEQVLLNGVPALKSPMGGAGYANSIADARTDLGEVSTKCLSYSTKKQSVTLYSGGTGMENQPLTPVLSPLTQYTNLFNNFVPSTAFTDAPVAAAAPAADQMLTSLASKRSVLDFAMAEINQLKSMAPSGAQMKLKDHYDAVFSLEDQLSKTIDRTYPVTTGTGGSMGGTGGMMGSGGSGSGGMNGSGGRGGMTGSGGMIGSGGMGGNPGTGGAGNGGGCKMTPAPPPNTKGPDDYASGMHGNYGSPKNGSTDDATTHQTVGKLHLDVLRAAFLCDIIRCGTYQWSPGTNHVGFKGFYPGDDSGIYQHHPVSHAVGNGSATEGSTPDGLTTPQIRFLYNIQNWYFARHAENIKLWKSEIDAYGNSLLDSTIIPFVTEVATYNHDRTNMAAMIFGGKTLGMQVGQYKSGSFSINSFWGTIAQAFGASTTAPFASPIAGLWTKPT
jgi:hypothetical protein